MSIEISDSSNPVKELLIFYKEIGADFVEINRSFFNKKPNILHDKFTKSKKTISHHQIKLLPDDSLEKINSDIQNCSLCGLVQNKINYVPGEGSANPEILFIGEGPGEQEDNSGRPFVGDAGKLLDKIIDKMGYNRKKVFIANIVKCRPPNNRNPNSVEARSCFSFLKRQIDFLKPKIIVSLGKTATNYLLGKELYISKVRGMQFKYNNIPVIPTFHPSYILHQTSVEKTSKAKWQVWSDMEKVLENITHQTKQN